MPDDIKEAVVAAENRGFWTDSGIDPKRHPAGGVQQRLGQRDAGCVDDHPAVREDPLPHPGALLHAQDQGSDPVAEGPAAAVARSEILHGYLNTIYFGRGAYGIQTAAAGLLQEAGQEAQPARVRGAGQRAQQPDRLRPGQRQGSAGEPQGALRLRAQQHGRHGQDHRGGGREGQEEAAQLPERSRRRAPTATRRATC